MIAVIIIGIHRKIKLLVLVKTIEAIKGIPPPNIILAMLYEIKIAKKPLLINWCVFNYICYRHRPQLQIPELSGTRLIIALQSSQHFQRLAKNLLRMLKAPLIIQMHLKSLFDLFYHHNIQKLMLLTV